MKYSSILIFTALLFSCQSQSYKQGAKLYNGYCASCHMEDGTGLGKVLPPVANSDYLQNNFLNLPCIMKHGIQDTIIVNGNEYSQAMAGINLLSPVEISNIINYINFKWYNDTLPSPNLKEIQAILDQCESK